MSKYIYKIGRRKATVATVRLYEDKGESTINGKQVGDIYRVEVDQIKLQEPFKATNLNPKDFYFTAKVSGGGINGGLDAIRLAISRALVTLNPENRTLLRAAGLLTRDPRMVERKKTGLKKARKSEQYSKR